MHIFKYSHSVFELMPEEVSVSVSGWDNELLLVGVVNILESFKLEQVVLLLLGVPLILIIESLCFLILVWDFLSRVLGVWGWSNRQREHMSLPIFWPVGGVDGGKQNGGESINRVRKTQW